MDIPSIPEPSAPPTVPYHEGTVSPLDHFVNRTLESFACPVSDAVPTDKGFRFITRQNSSLGTSDSTQSLYICLGGASSQRHARLWVSGLEERVEGFGRVHANGRGEERRGGQWRSGGERPWLGRRLVLLICYVICYVSILAASHVSP